MSKKTIALFMTFCFCALSACNRQEEAKPEDKTPTFKQYDRISLVDDVTVETVSENIVEEEIVEENVGTLDYNIILKDLIRVADGQNIVLSFDSLKNILKFNSIFSDAEYEDITDFSTIKSPNSITLDKIWVNTVSGVNIDGFGVDEDYIFPIDMSVSVEGGSPTDDKNHYIDEITHNAVAGTKTNFVGTQSLDIESIVSYNINFDVKNQRLVPASEDSFYFTQYDGQEKHVDYYETISNLSLTTPEIAGNEACIIPLTDGYKFLPIRIYNKDTEDIDISSIIKAASDPNNIKKGEKIALYMPEFLTNSYYSPNYDNIKINKGIINENIKKYGDITESVTTQVSLNHIENIVEETEEVATISNVYYTQPFLYVIFNDSYEPAFLGIVQNFDGVIGTADAVISGQDGMDRWTEVNKEAEEQYQAKLAEIPVENETDVVKKYTVSTEEKTDDYRIYLLSNDIDHVLYKSDEFDKEQIPGLFNETDSKLRVVDYATFDTMWRYYTNDSANPYYGMDDTNFVVCAELYQPGWTDIKLVDYKENEKDINVYLRRKHTGIADSNSGFFLVIPTEKPVDTLVNEIEMLKPMELGVILRSSLYPSTEDTGYFVVDEDK